MTFLVPPYLHDKKLAKTHWAESGEVTRRTRMTRCGRFLFVGGKFGRGVNYAEYDTQYVTCHVCLYHLGLYVPLVKLREHQWAASGSALTLEHWTRIYEALRRGPTVHRTPWARPDDHCPERRR